MRITLASGFREGYEVGLEHAYERAFTALGHQVSRVACELPGGRIRGLDRIESRLRFPDHQKALLRQIRQQDPELFLAVKGTGLSGETVAALRREGLRVANIFPDNPFEAAAQAFPAAELHSQFRHCEVVFVPDRFSAGQLRAQGIRAEFLAFARDPGAHVYDPDERVPEASPFVFVGNPDSERIRYLRAIADLGLRLYGAWDWANLSETDPLKACVAGGVQLGSEMVRTMRSARVSLNILRQSQKTAHNMRTFEIPASGVCALAESTVCVQELMRDGHETVLFTSPEDLRKKAISLLESPDRAAQIAAAGYERVRNDTYERRATEILGVLGLG